MRSVLGKQKHTKPRTLVATRGNYIPNLSVTHAYTPISKEPNSHCQTIKAMAHRLSALKHKFKKTGSQTQLCTNWLVCRIGLLSTLLGSWGNGWVTLKRCGGPSNVLEGGHKS